MLTQETKRKIDSARNILVGKVPDPKAQVGQITTALIYKFMDDMDKEAIELGGKARFFTKGFEKYAWTKLLDKKLGGHERLELYGEAVAKMSQNPHIPQLFRDIFKDAFLPYRSPETLTLFLKEINGFTYDHSEDLGNAFEYLLSILGSQGDAGQFRTPRHIIDFIAEVVDPKKEDKILDPACGTAGFLISAYKHILKQQKDKPLTPDEKQKLMNNLVGYDISPDMVKLSKVNMYLHGFAEPKIFEYDTLSSEEKWDEMYDVIMANPPFMSPSGGIRPHKRFSVQANRAEVLFVDYIKEHLRPNGRAGIIVPEGIIFQSSGSYKQLRKMLVEDGLFAVVSLPAGVFNPYSNVKTSILFFDNSLAKKTDKILFVRVLNDGFDLGAQRRPVDRNDLVRPDNEVDATKVLKGQRIAIETGTKNLWLQENSLFAYEITKEQISRTGDYSLSAEKYRLDNLGEQKNQKWRMVKLGDVCEILDNKRKPVKEADREKGPYPYYGATGIVDYVDEYLFDEKLVLVGEDGAKWGVGDKTAFIANGKYWVNNHAHVLRPTENKLLDDFLVAVLNSMDLSQYVTGVTVPKLNQEKLRSIKIPLPPIDVQKEIVEQIEVKQNAIEHAKAIIENLERERRYFGQSLRKLDNMKYLTLGEICEVKGGKRLPQGSNFASSKTNRVYIRVVDFRNGSIDMSNLKYITENVFKQISRYTISKNDVYISIAGTIGSVGVIPEKLDGASLTENAAKLVIKDGKILDNKYLASVLNDVNAQTQISQLTRGVGVPKLALERIATIKIPLPALEVQKQMVEAMEKEEEIISSNRQLIEVMENKIGEVLNTI